MFLPAARLVGLVAGVAGLTLGLAEQGPIPFLVLVAALISVFVIDGRPLSGVPAAVAAAMGFAAFGVAAAEFMGGDIEARILAGTHLISYLSVVVLLQAKRRSDLYRLLTLSTLQMALAALLTNSVWLAPALLLFIALAFLAMSSVLWTRMRVDAGNDADFVDSDSGFAAIRRLIRPALRLTVTTAVLGGIGFAFVPRVWSGNTNMFNNELPPGATAETGFSERVTLGEIGQVMESDDLVCEISSKRVESGEVVRIDAEAVKLGLSDMLLRGAVMDRYEEGAWLRARGTLLGATAFRNIGLQGTDSSQWIEHSIKLEPVGTRILFTPGWIADIDDVRSRDRADRIDFDAENQVFSRSDEADLTDRFEYRVTTRANWTFGPNPRNFVNFTASFRTYRILDRLKSIGGETGSALRADLRSFVEEQIPGAVSAESQLDAAHAVLAYLRDSGHYGYTLDLKRSNRSIDPVVDFLRNSRAGHCEYFASAMALLLRSVDVPARVVNGFKGGDYDEEDGVYRIRQLHAHAWVEVYDFDSRGWYTYDPTPAAAREAIVSERSRNANVKGNGLDYLQSLWGQGMFLTRQQQQRLIYGPLSDAATGRWEAISSAADGMMGGRLGQGGGSVAGVMVVMFLIAGTSVLVWSFRRSRKGSNRAADRRKASREADSTGLLLAPWYERFAELVRRRLGRERGVSETQQEFAATITENAVNDQLLDAGLSSLAPSITDSYYRSRFGRLPIESETLQQINDELARLESAEIEGGSPSK